MGRLCYLHGLPRNITPKLNGAAICVRLNALLCDYFNFMEDYMRTFDKCCTIRRMLLNRSADVMAYDNWNDDFAVKQIRCFPDELRKMDGGEDLFGIQPAEMTDKQLDELGFGKWTEENPMRLIPLWLLPFLAEEIETECINGEKKLIKKSEMDNDNRWGCLAYGVIPADA